jgi:hypothetical protein
MNERIKLLAKQAGIIGQSETAVAPPIEQFAKLIIQDCADLAYSHNIFSRGRPWNLVVKEHFGIPIADTDIPPYLRTTGVAE